MNSLRCTQLYLCLFFAAVIGTFWGPSVSQATFIVGLAIAVVMLGLPHGALDFSVAKSLKLFTSLWSASIFILIYVLIAGLSIVFWVQFPALGLGLFLAVSIYHFSADWRAIAPKYAALCLASIILCGPAMLHSAVLVELFAALLLSQNMAYIVISLMQIVFAVSGVVFVGYLVSAVRSKALGKGWHVAEYITLIISSLLFTPLLHFTLYFCVLHSPKHILDINLQLKLSMRQSILKSLPFVALTVLIGLGLYYWLGTDNLSVSLLRWTFIGLFGLTMSHMLLVSVWHRSARASSQ